MTQFVDAGLLLLESDRRITRLGSGKIRDLFAVGWLHAPLQIGDLLLQYASDRISARDFVFGFHIPELGAIRNLMTLFWKRKLERAGIPTDLIAGGRSIRDHLPPNFPVTPQLMKQLSVVRYYQLIEYELIVRYHLLGSAWKEYVRLKGPETSRDNTVNLWGHDLPGGLFEGSPLAGGLFTPTTKAKVGHDMPVSVQEVREKHSGLEEAVLRVGNFIKSDLELNTNIRLLDFKAEFALDPRNNQYIFCDEFSPDSARFCSSRDYSKLISGQKDKVKFLDKEWFRVNYADVIDHGVLGRLDPTHPNHIAFVKTWVCPQKVITEVRRRYNRTFELTTGYTLKDCASAVFGITA